MQGLTREEAKAQQPAGWSALCSGRPDARIPGGGESVDDLAARVVAGAPPFVRRDHKHQRNYSRD